MNERDRLADYAHRAWSGWMRYVFSKSISNDDGSITIPLDLVKRWMRQMNTNMLDLPENERASDYKEADEMLSLLDR